MLQVPSGSTEGCQFGSGGCCFVLSTWCAAVPVEDLICLDGFRAAATDPHAPPFRRSLATSSAALRSGIPSSRARRRLGFPTPYHRPLGGGWAAARPREGIRGGGSARRRIKAHGRRVCSGSPTQWIRHADGPPLGRRVLGGGGGRHLCPLVGTARIREVDPRAAFSRCRVRVRVTARSRSAALRSTPWRRRPPRPWREWRCSAR